MQEPTVPLSFPRRCYSQRVPGIWLAALVLLAATLTTGPSYSQAEAATIETATSPGYISGEARDVETGERIPFATVRVFRSGTEESVNTDVEGYFAFPLNAAHADSIQVQSIGFKDLTLALTPSTPFPIIIYVQPKREESESAPPYNPGKAKPISVTKEEIMNLPVMELSKRSQRKMARARRKSGKP